MYRLQDSPAPICPRIQREQAMIGLLCMEGKFILLNYSSMYAHLYRCLNLSRFLPTCIGKPEEPKER